MTVLSGGEKKIDTGAKSEGSLIERMSVCQSVWMQRKKGRCAGVVEGAGTASEERGYAGPTGCGFAGPGTVRGREVRTRRSSAWKLAEEWCAVGFGRRQRERRRD